MRKEKLWRALFCGGLASAMILTGCSQSSDNSLEVSDTSVSADSFSDHAVDKPDQLQ